MNSGSCSQMSSWKWPIGVNTSYYNIATLTVFSPEGEERGWDSHMNGAGMLVGSKGDQSGRGPTFFDP